jgi:hypothetical protein
MEKKIQKILFAMVGSFIKNEDGEMQHAGFMTKGMCIPLAVDTTDGNELLEHIEALGEDEIADILTADYFIESPLAGGLWVAEFETEMDYDPPGTIIFRLIFWRMPTKDEISALLFKQLSVSERDKEIVPEENLGKWVYYGALV